MGRSLTHVDVNRIVGALAEAKIIDLDASIRSLIEPVARMLPEDPGELVGLHVLCCNEYALVTGVVGGLDQGIAAQAGRIQSDLA